MIEYSIVLPVGPNDIKLLQIWKISYDTFINKYIPIVIVSPLSIQSQIKQILYPYFTYITDAELIKDENEQNKSDHNNWMVQQLIKLLVSFKIKTKYYIILDCDVFPKRYISERNLIRDNKIITQIANNDSFQQKFFSLTYSALYNKPKNNKYKTMSPLPSVSPQSFCTKIAREAINFTKSKGNIKQFLDKMDATEYSIYFVYAMETGNYEKYHSYRKDRTHELWPEDEKGSIFNVCNVLKWDPKLLNGPEFFSLIQSNINLPVELIMDMLPFTRPYLFENYDLPLISCLMITKDRLDKVKIAVNCFINQTYPNKELIILCDSDDGTREYIKDLNRSDITYIFPKGSNRTLGDLRNLSVQIAKGDYVAQWDDDDWYHPSRLSVQMYNILKNNMIGCLLGEWILTWPSKNYYGISDYRKDGYEGSMLINKNYLPQYPNKRKYEDTDMMQQYLKNHRHSTIILGKGYEWLYVYLVHGSNTWDTKHFDIMFKGGINFVDRYELGMNNEICGKVITDLLKVPYNGFEYFKPPHNIKTRKTITIIKIITIVIIIVSVILLFIFGIYSKNIVGILSGIILIVIFIMLTRILLHSFKKKQLPKKEQLSMNIPKFIFQTSETKAIPPGMIEAMNSWKTMNPTYKHFFFDNTERRNFMSQYFDNNTIKAYDTLIPGAYKADLWRYCVLYIYGGVYADIKSVCKINLTEIIDSPFISVRDRSTDCIANSFICTVPKHPFLKRAIEISVKNILNNNYGESSLDITGPRVLGRALNDVLGLSQNNKFALGKQNINSYEFTLFEVPKPGEIILRNSKTIIQAKYDGHLEENNNWTISYDEAYYNNPNKDRIFKRL